MYVEQYIVVRSRNQCCHGNATIGSLCIVVYLDVAVNIKVFRVAMDMQQWVSFPLLLSYKIFRTAVNKTKVLASPSKVPDNFVRF
jgi:hypothetical protein